MTASEFDALRGRRREMALQLRAEGLPVREIAERLGVTHPTVLADLKGPAMTTTAVPAEPAVISPMAAAPSSEEQRAAGLAGVLGDFDALGLADLLGEARVLLGRVGEVQAAVSVEAGRVRARRDALVAQVVAGEIGVAAAAGELRQVDAFDDQHAVVGEVGRRAVAQLRRQAVQAARAHAVEAFKALHKRAVEPVGRAVAAGRVLVDSKAAVKALRPAQRLADVGAGPAVPAVSLETIQHDPRLMAAWVEAGDAHAEYVTIFNVAASLCRVLGDGRSVVMVDGGDPDLVAEIGERMTPRLHLAVCVAAGLNPGVHVRAGRRRAGDVAAVRVSAPPTGFKGLTAPLRERLGLSS